MDNLILNVSVIIPTYNRKNLLKRALHSVSIQTFVPQEIIVVDDGSSDGTKDWVLEGFPYVRYIYQHNSGVSSARNRGIREAKGSWIAFLDSDDEWMPDKLEKQERAINNSKEAWLCHTNEIWVRNSVRVNQMKKHQKYGGNVFENCLDICRISPSSALIKREVFEMVGLFDESLKVCEDYDLWLRITSVLPIIFLDQPLIVKYGGHADQLSRVDHGIEQYRIKSLEKILRSESLSVDQSKRAKLHLLKKLEVFSNGLEKRKKLKELSIYKKKIEFWSK
jgi:glycosyltransferase involved in cell wall biosynthesis